MPASTTNTLPQAEFTSNTIGTAQDTVSLQLGGQEIMSAESWEIHEGILEQPAAWSIRCGWGGVAADFIQQFPKGTTFQLYVGGALQQTGRIDGIKVSGTGSATEITFKGRDSLARLHDSYVVANQTFTDSTYTNLVWRALSTLGLVTGQNPDSTQLQTTNEANRQLKAGKAKTIVQIAPARTVDQILTDANGAPVSAQAHQQLQANVGERWLSFLRRYLDPAGLILWAAADGTYVLSAPNTQQQPLYNLVRRKVGSNSNANVLDVDFTDDATHRHSYAACYARSGGRKSGRSLATGDEVSDDLFNNPTGWYANNQPAISFRECNCQNTEQAENFARRKLAEEARNGYFIDYTITGHTLPVKGGNGRAVLTPDTIVAVNDEELGISGNFYLESLVRRRGPETSTRIHLIRPQDIILGPDT